MIGRYLHQTCTGRLFDLDVSVLKPIRKITVVLRFGQDSRIQQGIIQTARMPYGKSYQPRMAFLDFYVGLNRDFDADEEEKAFRRD